MHADLLKTAGSHLKSSLSQAVTMSEERRTQVAACFQTIRCPSEEAVSLVDRVQLGRKDLS